MRLVENSAAADDRAGSILLRALTAVVVLGAMVVTMGRSGAIAGEPVAAGHGSDSLAPAQLPDFDAACDSDNSYLVTACYPSMLEGRGGSEAVVLFRDTPSSTPPIVLADQATVGSVWGLAYSAPERAVYAAAYHKRAVAFGPGGPGAIYRIDLASQSTSLFATVPNAGPDRHDPALSGRSTDRLGRDWAGKTSLADLDLSPDGSELFVVNLNDRRIYRFDVASGALLGSFDHGAAAEPWAEDARPFGLKVLDGAVLHGVVRTAESTRRRAELAGSVYSSRPDGSDMRLVAAFDMDYPRGDIELPVPPARCGQPCWSTHAPLRWNAWLDGYRTLRQEGYYAVYPMPMVSDLELDHDGHLIVGLKDRQGDITLLAEQYGQDEDPGLGVGDILLGHRSGEGWAVDPAAEHYVDEVVYSDQSALGGLAQSWRQNVLVAASLGDGEEWRYFPPIPNGGALWYDNRTGDKLRHEQICAGERGRAGSAWTSVPAEPMHNEGNVPLSLGDVEELCGPVPTPSSTPVPTDTPSATPTTTAAPSTTVTATVTATPTPTPTATPRQRPVYLPVALREHCDPTLERADIALVLDTSGSMLGQKLADAKSAALSFVGLLDLAPGRDQVAVVRFDTEAELAHELSSGRAAVEAAIRGLAARQGTHIDKGLRQALAELQSERRIHDNTPVIVLLTDGVQTGTVGGERVAAVEVRAAGIALFTIGLGADVDEATLIEMAGGRGRYYFAPDSSHLAQIYAEIAYTIGCPPEHFWGQRP